MDYEESRRICAQRYPFYALVMAALRQADTRNFERLRAAFPEVERELAARYEAPGGELPGETLADAPKQAAR